MRLLFVHERFGAWGGAEVNLHTTAVELKRRGHSLGILHGPPTGKEEAAWQKTFSDRYLIKKENNSEMAKETLRRFQPDLVYVHKMDDLEVLETLVESGAPLVRMVHDHEMYCMRSYKYHYLSRKICVRPATPFCIFPCGAFVARNRGEGFPLKYVSYTRKKKELRLNQQFNRLIAVSDYVRQELLRNGFNDRKIEIQSPVPPMGDPSLRSTFSERNLIIYVGQIVRGKGVDILLESLALIKTPFECIILGEGTHRNYCEQLSARLGLDKKVRFAGFVPQEELKNYYRECTVVAVSSVWPEPFATVGTEVMRYGIPVVAFDAGGIKDWLHHGENGYLVPWMNRTEYAARLEELLKNKTRARELGARGFKLVSERYDFSRYVSDLEKTFAQVLEENREPIASAR
ncbi:MAG: glycosyltransferase family 4 protein [Limisphaerales bacterium]